MKLVISYSPEAVTRTFLELECVSWVCKGGLLRVSRPSGQVTLIPLSKVFYFYEITVE